MALEFAVDDGFRQWYYIDRANAAEFHTAEPARSGRRNHAQRSKDSTKT